MLSEGLHRTFNAGDLARAEAGGGSGVFGARDARGADGTLDVDNRGACRGTPLADWHGLLRGSHISSLVLGLVS